MKRNTPTSSTPRETVRDLPVYSVVPSEDPVDEDEGIRREWEEFAPVVVRPRWWYKDQNRRGRRVHPCR